MADASLLPAFPAAREHPDHAAQAGLRRAQRIGRMAVRSLYLELALYPKPGLVSLVDNGSHDDMDASTFVRSLFSLRRYFVDIAHEGAAGAAFPVLRQLGIEAERRMLEATGGINTHRGAIFSLGLLCAGAARCIECRVLADPLHVREALLSQWGSPLAQHESGSGSHGFGVLVRYAASGARQEAANGFPSVFNLALPRLQQTLREGRDLYCARIDTLFVLMAHMSDTNVFHRGGPEGARMVREQAWRFLEAGGTAAPDWHARAVECHRIFVERRLSPGGAADLLAATSFLHQLAEGRSW